MKIKKKRHEANNEQYVNRYGDATKLVDGGMRGWVIRFEFYDIPCYEKHIQLNYLSTLKVIRTSTHRNNLGYSKIVPEHGPDNNLIVPKLKLSSFLAITRMPVKLALKVAA